MSGKQYFTRGESLVARAVGSEYVFDLKSSSLKQEHDARVPHVILQKRLRDQANNDPLFLTQLAELNLEDENPTIRRLIQTVIREHIPTDLEVLAELVPASFHREPKDFIAASIKNEETTHLKIPLAQSNNMNRSADGSRAVLQITDYSTSSRLCLLMSNLSGESGPPNTHIVIQSKDRYLYAMYPGGRRANLLFSWINEQPNDSLPEILKSIIAFDSCLLSEREINRELGVNPQTIFLQRVRDDYPICFNAFADMVGPYL
jgi:hypothetical protein